MKQLLSILMIVALAVGIGCGGESPIEITNEPGNPPPREMYCPGTDSWWTGCNDCHY